MRLSVNWLKEFINIPDDLQGFSDALTMAGLEVEETKLMSCADLMAGGGAGEKDDIVLNVKITPNRGDWLSVLGVAREGAPLLNEQIAMPRVPDSEWVDEQMPITIQAPDLCRRYAGIIIRGVKVGKSPGWMQDRLVAAGMRPINNVVDITNYVMLELGQPLHAFDLSLLHGQQIIVRRAKAGEKMVSIDNQDRALDENILVIADADRPVAVAGIMGGVESEINDNTTDILLESANFDMVSVRRTSKRLGLSTESSYRFERSVDPSICEYAAIRAATLIKEYAGAASIGKPNDVYPLQVKPMEIKVVPDKANRMLGLNLTISEMTQALAGYSILTSMCDETLICRIPTYRPDMTLDVDVIEEIGRGYGYDKIPMSLPNIPLQGKDSPEGELRRKLRRILMSCGLQEVLSHSMIEHKLAAMSGRTDIVAIRNPLSLELDSMRRMLIPNLLDVLIRNQGHSSRGIGLFESGKIYFTDKTVGYDEKLSVAGVVCGSMWDTSWGMGKTVPVHDFFSCKGIVEALFAELGITGAKYEAHTDVLLHPTRAARVLVGDKEIGILGQISPSLAASIDIRGEAYAFELDVNAILSILPSAARFSELPRYPSVSRHITMKVAESVNFEQINTIATQFGGEMARSVELIDIFRGEKLGAGVKSVTISVEFRSDTRTLMDDEVSQAVAEIKSALETQLKASL